MVFWLRTAAWALLPTLFFSSARAHEPGTPVDSPRIQLVGKGVRSGDLGQSLALACADESCQSLQFVYWKSARDAVWVGSAIRRPQGGNARQNKKAVRLAIQDFFDHHQTVRSEAKLKRHGQLTFVVIGGAMVAVALPMSAAGAALTVLTGGAFLGGTLGLYLFFCSHGFIDVMANGRWIDVTLSNDKQWNWSDQGASISAQKFSGILEQIVSGRPYVEDYQQLDIREHRMERKKSRLERQGVTF